MSASEGMASVSGGCLQLHPKVESVYIWASSLVYQGGTPVIVRTRPDRSVGDADFGGLIAEHVDDFVVEAVLCGVVLDVGVALFGDLEDLFVEL